MPHEPCADRGGQGQLTGEVVADGPVHGVLVSVVTVNVPTSSTRFFASCTCTLVVAAPVFTARGVNPGRCRVTRYPVVRDSLLAVHDTAWWPSACRTSS